MEAVVNVNGHLVDAAHAVVSVFDHGFLYGEGVYETMRTYNGRVFLLERHLARLRSSAERIRLSEPLTQAELIQRIETTIGAAVAAGHGEPRPDWYVRILLTRGVGELTYDPAACPTPSVIIIVKPHVAPDAEVVARGVNVALVGIVRNHPESVNPIIKSNNLLNNALAMQEAFRRGAYEGVMRNYKGELSECTQSNLFIVKDGEVLTPPLEAGLLAGVTRGFILEMGAEIGIRAREATLRDADLLGADEAFFTSSTRELMPIVRVDDRVIGSGRPGPLTRRLLDLFRQKASELTSQPSGARA